MSKSYIDKKVKLAHHNGVVYYLQSVEAQINK